MEIIPTFSKRHSRFLGTMFLLITFAIILPPLSTILISSLALILSTGSLLYTDKSSAQREVEQNIKHIETSLDKFYIPLCKVLTTPEDNTIINCQEKISEINFYIHLAESCTRYRFRVYQKTGWFKEELLGQVKKDIEEYQVKYKNLKEYQT